VSAETLRRAPEPREQVNRCAKCGRVDVPLNEDELWRYAVTGDGLGKFCPHNARRIPGCKWQPFYCVVPA
jgi:hypothetical protein